MNSSVFFDRYDHKGQLRLPRLFWLILLLQARSWLLLIIAGASRQQGSSLLALFYPDNDAFWLALALGTPAVAGLLLTGYRQRWPRLWQCWRWVLCAGLIANLLISPPLFDNLFLLPGLDLLACGYLLVSRYLKACFNPVCNHVV